MDEEQRQVGLGRVVDDRLSTGSPDADDPGGLPGAMGEPVPNENATTTGDRPVEDDSADSFPASDPPTWMSDGVATPDSRSGDQSS